jgi:PAS domain S-box-containing protein
MGLKKKVNKNLTGRVPDLQDTPNPEQNTHPSGVLESMNAPDYKSLFEDAPLPYQSLDEQGTILEVNKPWLEMLGYTRQEVASTYIGRYHSKASLKLLKLAFPVFLKEGKVKDAVFELVTRSGESVNVSVNGTVQKDAEGRFIATHCILTNITHRRNAEKELRKKHRELGVLKKRAEESEAKYRLIVENQSDLVVKFNTRGNILFVSPSFCGMFGKTEEELLGQSLIPLVHKDDIALVEQSYKDLFKEPYTSYVEQRALTIHGWRWLGWSTKSVRDKDGNIESFVSVGRDVHDRVEAVKALRESELKYKEASRFMESLFNVIPDVLGVQDANHKIIRYNAAGYAFLNQSQDKVEGRKCFEIIGREIPCELCATSEAYRTKKPAHIERYIPEMDIYLDIYSYPILDEEGNITQVIEHLHDNTARKRAEIELKKEKQRAEESDQLKTTFLANLSHEIRTPMNAILGFSSLLKDSSLDTSKRDSYIGAIHKSGYHLLSIINDIVEISKIDTNQVVVHSSKVVLNELMHDVYESFRPSFPPDGSVELRLNVQIQDENDTLVTDAVKLRQVLINLISNGFKFTGRGYIEFGYYFRNNSAVFYVKDTGIGINQANHQMIFERFRRVEGDLAIKKGGSGLGLAISKAYVELMGGEIMLESEPGKGSVFTFNLPLHPSF